jgi:mono/diheme cytochrome c family protein
VKLHILAITAMSLAAALLACRTDMHDQPRMKPLRRSDFFADHREGRPLVAGTIARGQLIEDPYFITGMERPNQPGNRLPFPLTADVLRRGQERFDIYCSPCHSRIGDGNGMIVQRGYRHPPSFHTDILRVAPIGHFFDVMTNGFGAMPDYAQQVSPADRWAIAAYIRALQLAQNATVADVDPAMRDSISHAPSTITVPAGLGTMGERPAGETQVRENLGNEATGGANPQMVPQPQQKKGAEQPKK